MYVRTYVQAVRYYYLCIPIFIFLHVKAPPTLNNNNNNLLGEIHTKKVTRTIRSYVVITFGSCGVCMCVSKDPTYVCM
ncbi:hypothetical protein F4775DRAFT_573499 [Biscogniauxia sp. FL1348]|nr:hypothetical protein F4775DRAFT_573499 [Biscogniauxia sp. FL1348]